MQNHPGPIASLRKRLFLDAEVENHPLFASLLSRAFDREAEQRIALEIFYVVNAFPRFLSALVAQIEDWRLRLDLVESLFDEHSHMRPAAVHVMTYRSFLRALGISEAQIDHYEPALPALCYVRAMLDLCARQPVPEAIGALAVVEETVARVSPIAACFGTMRSSGSALGTPDVHEGLDVSHADGLYEAGSRMGPGAIPGVLRGMRLGIYYHMRLYSDLLRERHSATRDHSASSLLRQ